MSDEPRIAEARKHAKAKFDFYVHLVVYVAVICLLLIINLVTSPEYLWVFWPAMGWGIGLLAHGATAFYMSPKKEDIVDTLTQRELDKQRSEHHRRG